MKKHWKLISSIIVLIILGIYIGWLDNGPRKVNVDELPSRLDP